MIREPTAQWSKVVSAVWHHGWSSSWPRSSFLFFILKEPVGRRCASPILSRSSRVVECASVLPLLVKTLRGGGRNKISQFPHHCGHHFRPTNTPPHLTHPRQRKPTPPYSNSVPSPLSRTYSQLTYSTTPTPPPKNSDRSRHFWWSYDVINFWRDVILDVFQKTYFYWTDLLKNPHDGSFWRKMFTKKKSDWFRHFWWTNDVIIFDVTSYHNWWRQKCRNRSEFFFARFFCQTEQSWKFLQKSVHRNCVF